MTKLLLKKDPDLARWDVRNPFQSFVDEFFAGNHLYSTSGFSPRINVSETETQYKVSVELAGLEEKDFEVTMEKDLLTIKGEKKRTNEEKNENFHCFESSYGAFERCLRLPELADNAETTAKFKNGILLVTLAKNKPEDRTHRIKVNVEETKD